ncbi:GxxExxY protein [Myxococcota bacterium]
MNNQDNITTIQGALGSYREVAATRSIIGAAIDVHKTLGPGFLESVYHNALCILLSERGIEFEKEPEVPVLFHDVEVGTHRLDILIPDQLVVELKAIKQLERVHFAVVRSYLRATGIEDGLILNFAKPTLEIRRVGGAVPVPCCRLPAAGTQEVRMTGMISEQIQTVGLCRHHGPGCATPMA